MHTHRHEKKVWLPDANLVRAIAQSAASLRSSDEEFEHAFQILKKYPARVTMFGSARSLPSDPFYKKAEEIAAALSQEGYSIVSGGGGGIMEAANKGAKEAGGHTIGFNIVLPHEQKLNPYTTDHLAFHYFFTRKVMMTFYAHGFIYFPGGFGTLDELFEVITLIQTKKMAPVPIILVGTEYWSDLDVFIKKHMLKANLITSDDQALYTITENTDEICQIIDRAFDT